MGYGSYNRDKEEKVLNDEERAEIERKRVKMVGNRIFDYINANHEEYHAESVEDELGLEYNRDKYILFVYTIKKREAFLEKYFQKP